MRKEININNWERKEHFEFYSKCATPHYCIAFNIDITNLLQFTRKNHISFYYSLIYLCTQSINEIDEFLLETEDNKVYKILTIVFGLIGAVPILVCIGIAIWV